MACRTVMPLLLSGTFCILLNGAGWVVKVGVNHLVMYQHSCCWFSPSQTEIIQQQLPHCSSHGCPHVQDQLSRGANQSNTLLRTSSLLAKTESRGYTEFILMKLHICISRDVSHWKLNLQSSGLPHPSSPLTSCALKLFCQSSGTLESTLPSRQGASQKHSQKAAGGRICSCISVRCARNGIARNCCNT